MAYGAGIRWIKARRANYFVSRSQRHTALRKGAATRMKLYRKMRKSRGYSK